VSLYTKTVLIISSVLLTLVALLYVVSQSILLNSYNQLEEHNVQQNVQRALNAISHEITQLGIENGDYASWDDTYAFVQDHNTAYIENNLVNETFTSLSIDVMVFMDMEGQIVYAKAVDFYTGEEQSIPEDLYPFLGASSPLLNITDEEYGVQGIVMIDSTPMIVSSQHIYTSQLEGPPTGTMVMGRLLDQARIEGLGNNLDLSVTVKPLSGRVLPGDFQFAQTNLVDPSSIFVRPMDAARTGGYALLNDLNGTPAIILRVDLARDIYAQGQATVSFFVIALGVISLIFVGAALILLDRLMLSRISRLSSNLSAVRLTANFSRQLPVHGNDELASLAADINATLQALSQSQHDLQKVNDELEARVLERTQELSASNQSLAEEILQHQRTQEKLAQARDQAVEALELKARILANVSHDSRTPLTVILLRTEMMLNGRYGPVTDKQVETLDGILVNARQLLGFLNNLLNESQAQAKNLSARFVPFQPRALLNEVALTASPLVERKGLAFFTELAADVPATLHGDPERLNQILMNLVENAIKFTNQGRVSIRISQAENDSWSLEVSDTGIGIRDDAQARIFDAFWQVEGTSSNGNNLGVGLGLSIVKQFTTLMGGTISVSSVEGEGSTFTVTLPLQQPEQETVAEK
jgi:signal transduction histidine kinase